MRVVKRDLPRLILVPESLDDLWHLDHILDKGDFITSQSERRFKSEGGATERKKIKIKIHLEDWELHKHSNKLRLLGKIEEAHPQEYVALGTHHTIEVGAGDKITIDKIQWKDWQLQRIKEAIASTKKPKLIIIVMDDEVAKMFSLHDYGIEERGVIKSGKSGKDREIKEFKPAYFKELSEALSHFETDRIIVAGPAFWKDEFADFAKQLPIGKKIITADTGGMGVQEVLKSEAIEKINANARIVLETKLIEKALEEVAKGGLATYGEKEVEAALDYGAVEVLLIIDTLFNKKREKMEKLLEKAKQTNSEYHLVGSDHEAGKKLKNVTGIAAILRFKVS